MTKYSKFLDELTPDDFKEHPVWEFTRASQEDLSCSVRPVASLPVNDLSGRLVGLRVKLRNGERPWGMCSNISLSNATATRHFLCLSIEKDGRWFPLGRYHDMDYERRGPAKLAEFLGLPVRDVFPIEYDITAIAIGDKRVLKGTIGEQVEPQLTESELINLALITED